MLPIKNVSAGEMRKIAKESLIAGNLGKVVWANKRRQE